MDTSRRLVANTYITDCYAHWQELEAFGKGVPPCHSSVVGGTAALSLKACGKGDPLAHVVAGNAALARA
jgi:hypothetical protein